MIEREERERLIDSLEVGDLVRFNGKLRVVRSLGKPPRRSPWTKRKPDRVYSVTFAIRRCSWTRKPHTTYARTDLYHADFEIVQKGYGAERGPLEVLLQRDVSDRAGASLLECCDVIGVID